MRTDVSARHKSTFAVPKMDCPSEERMVRMALDGLISERSLSFDLPARRVVVTHAGDAGAILARLAPLGLGASLERSEAAGAEPERAMAADDSGEARLLWILLSINAAMFAVELGVGLLAQSAGLMADSLDMFADAAVFGLALLAVGRSSASKTRAARAAGWLQLALALGALAEVGHRALRGSEPASLPMIAMGAAAMAANVACLVLVAKKRDAGAHMKASYIFTASDVIANAGVVVAGVLVAWTGSAYPDLVIGTAVALVVLSGGFRILKLR